MAPRLTWLSDEQRVRIEPLLPSGRRGARRVDDRRVIIGTVHMLRSGARWRDCPPGSGPYTTVYSRFNRWSHQGIWLAIFRGADGHCGGWRTVAIDATHIKAHRSAAGAKRGAFAQAVGTSRGGRTSKLHGLTDAEGLPRLLLISAVDINDMLTAEQLIAAAAGRFHRLIADRDYDTNKVREAVRRLGAEAAIPSTAARRTPLVQAQGLAARRHPL